MLKSTVQICAPLFSLLGAIVGAYGTYFSVRPYHPYLDAASLLRSQFEVFWLFLTGRRARASSSMDVLARITKSNEAAVGSAVLGIYFTFVALYLQSIGGLFWLLDAILFAK